MSSFFHCLTTLELCHRLFCIGNVKWAPVRGIARMLVTKLPKEKTPWLMVVPSLIRVLWLKRDARYLMIDGDLWMPFGI